MKKFIIVGGIVIVLSFNKKITISLKTDSERKCGSKIINKGNGSTPSVEGTLLYAGYYYCAYGLVNDSYEQQDSTNCTSRGHKWANQKCYYDKDGAGVNIINSCSNSSYIYLTVAQANSIRSNSNLSGCFPTVDKTPYCESGYTLSGDKCTKTIDATAN